MYEDFPIYIFFNELFYFACRILWEKIDIYWWNIISWLENVSLHHLLILILLLLLHQLLFILWLWATVNLTKDKKEKKFYDFKIRLIVKVYTHKWEIRDYQLSRWQGNVALCYSCFTSVLLERAEFRIFQDMHLLFLLLLDKIVFLALLWCSTSVFGSVVAGAFQIAFCAEIHANDVFLFFKNHFWHQHIKTIQKVQTALNFSKKKKKKKFKFARNAGTNAVPNVLYNWYM